MSILRDAVSTSIVLVLALVPGEGASTVGYVSSTATLGGERVATYSRESDVADALASSEITATDAARIRTAFKLTGITPSRVAVIRKDGSETYAEALDAGEAAGMPTGLNGYMWLTADTRTIADQEVISTWVEGRVALYLSQTADADAITAGLPAGLTARSQTAIAIHDTDTETADVRLAGACAGVPRPQFRPSGRAPLTGLAAYATALTAAQKTAALNNGFSLIERYDDPITSPQAWKDPKTMTGVSLAVAHSRVYLTGIVDLAARNFLNAAWTLNQSLPANEREIARMMGKIRLEVGKLIDAGDVEPTDQHPSGCELSGTASGGTVSITGTIFGNEDIGAVAINLSYTVG